MNITANTSFLELLANAQKASQIANDQKGKVPYPTYATVTDNKDPENKRRVKVALPSSPGVASYWFRRVVPFKDVDYPLPDIGQTVMVFFIDGIETEGCYLQIHNDTNPVRSKEDPINDYSEGIAGQRDVSITGADSLAVGGKLTTSADDIEFNSEKDINATVKGNIFMTALQAISLIAGQYVMLKAGTWFFKLFTNGTSEMGGGVLTINCGGFGINFVNVGTMNINSKAIATVGATDSDGDTIVNKGW